MSKRPPCTVALSTGLRVEEPTLDAAVALTRLQLRLAGPGATASITRRGLEPRYYAIGEDGVPRRAPHPGGRPAMAPEARRRPVLVHLAPATVEALDGLVRAGGGSRGVVIDRLVLEAAGRPGGP